MQLKLFPIDVFTLETFNFYARQANNGDEKYDKLIQSLNHNRKENVLGVAEVASDRFERMLSHFSQDKEVGIPTLGQ